MKVIKLGGRVQSNPALATVIADLWKGAPAELCVIHGGGDEISALQKSLGREPKFVNGRRVTTDDDIELVRMILSGSTNKRLVAWLASAGIPAVGISGEDGDLLRAEPIDAEGSGRSGRPVSANARLVTTLLASGFLPVISPVGTNSASTTKEALNVNGDDAAAVIAGALGAELWLVADVPGVMNKGSELIGEIDRSAADALVADGTVNKGMRAKLEAGFLALASGAASVRIAGLDAFSGRESGTLLSLTPNMT